MEAQAVVKENPFANAEACFSRLRDWLGGAEAMGMTHAEVESTVETDGREIMRWLFQGYLTLRREREVALPQLLGSDNVVRTLHRDSERQLETVFGTVTAGRTSYGARGETSLRPLDAELNLPPTRYSDGVERRVAEQAAQQSFDEVVLALRANTGAVIAKRQVEAVAVRAAQDFDAFYEKREPVPTEDAADSILVLSFDGKGVVMRKQDLRPETAAAAECSSHKLAKRLSKGEKRNKKRMATVAAIYSIAPFVRTPEQIVREMQPVHEALPKRPRPQDKRVSASIAKQPEDVIMEFFAEALRRDPERKKHWVVPLDGAETQLELVLACAKAAEVDVTVVLDVIHVIDYLWDAAFCFHAEGTKEAEAWVNERLLEILRGNTTTVAAGMRRSATKRNFSRKQRRAVDKCANYLLKYSAYMAYDRYLAAGYPIATGVIEGACRYLVKDRMDVTGARWSLAGAEAVLKLRALRKSGDFDAFWSFRQHREYERNHRRLYADFTPPRVSPSENGSPSRRLQSVQ